MTTRSLLFGLLCILLAGSTLLIRANAVAQGGCPAGETDTDEDGVCEEDDNCPDDPNPAQADLDLDGEGDVCDVCPDDPLNDVDGDVVCGQGDNCLPVANSDQLDSNSDGIGDACDCPVFVEFDGCDTGVLAYREDGSCLQDSVDICVQGAANDDELLACLTSLEPGLLPGELDDMIQCAVGLSLCATVTRDPNFCRKGASESACGMSAAKNKLNQRLLNQFCSTTTCRRDHCPASSADCKVVLRSLTPRPGHCFDAPGAVACKQVYVKGCGSGMSNTGVKCTARGLFGCNCDCIPQ